MRWIDFKRQLTYCPHKKSDLQILSNRFYVIKGLKPPNHKKTVTGTFECREHSAESKTTTAENTAETPGWDITQDDLGVCVWGGAQNLYMS